MSGSGVVWARVGIVLCYCVVAWAAWGMELVKPVIFPIGGCLMCRSEYILVFDVEREPHRDEATTDLVSDTLTIGSVIRGLELVDIPWPKNEVLRVHDGQQAIVTRKANPATEGFDDRRRSPEVLDGDFDERARRFRDDLCNRIRQIRPDRTNHNKGPFQFCERTFSGVSGSRRGFSGDGCVLCAISDQTQLPDEQNGLSDRNEDQRKGQRGDRLIRRRSPDGFLYLLVSIYIIGISGAFTVRWIMNGSDGKGREDQDARDG